VKSKYFLPALVTGFAAAVVSAIPFFSKIACCLVIPVAGIFSVILYKKSNQGGDDFLSKGNAVVLGFYTGLIAAFFTAIIEVLIILFTGTNEFIYMLPELESQLIQLEKDFANFPFIKDAVDQSLIMYRGMAEDIQNNRFSLGYTILSFLSSLFMNSVFAPLGALLGLAITNKNSSKENQ
jgi:hypothetical protein